MAAMRMVIVVLFVGCALFRDVRMPVTSMGTLNAQAEMTYSDVLVRSGFKVRAARTGHDPFPSMEL